jgi:DNA repair ATPase RecN
MIRNKLVLNPRFDEELGYPYGAEMKINVFYYYGVPISLIIALIFLNYFAILFGRESNLRKEALNKIEQFVAKEHELVSLGGQAAAAAHSLNTPLSTIKIISQDLYEQFKDKKDLKKDIELLVNQVERCSQILKKLTLNPGVEDDFIDTECTLNDYVSQIVKSSKEISKKRKEVIPSIESDLKRLTHRMGMKDAKFKIELNNSDIFLNNGKDLISFYFKSNKGRDFNLLKKIASGGEMSRIMLSIKNIIAKYLIIFNKGYNLAFKDYFKKDLIDDILKLEIF